jgi:indolepyruvate ferredoxin oxidoreductase beta subunit
MALSRDPLNLIICGVGGQGNILLSGLIGSALIKKGYQVTVGETFGAAQRGGAVFSSVRISQTRAYGPLVPEGKAHLVLGLEPLETLRILQKYGNSETICISNTYPVLPIGVLATKEEYPDCDELKETIKSLSKVAWFLNATNIALELGAQIATNIVMVGALISSAQLPLARKDIEGEMREVFPPERMELNLKALELGFRALRSQN